MSWWVAWWHIDRHGSWEFHIWIQRQQKERGDTGPGWSFWNLKACIQWHTSSSKATPPIGPFPLGVIFSQTTTLTKDNLGRKGFVTTWGSSPSSREARAGVAAGTWRQDTKQRPLRNIASLYSPGPPVQGGLGSHTSIINQENALTDLPSGQSDEGIFSVEVFSSLMTSACVKLTEN